MKASRSQHEVLQCRASVKQENRSYWVEIWLCPGCVITLEDETIDDLTFADVVLLIFEKLASPENPVHLTINFNRKGEIFLGQAELFALIMVFGGSLYLLNNGPAMLQCFNGLATILGKSFRTTDVKLLKDIMTNQYLQLEWYLSPGIKISKKFRKGLLIRKLLGKVQSRMVQGMRTRTFRDTFKKQPPIDAPTVKDHLNLSWGNQIQVCLVVLDISFCDLSL